MRWQEIEVVVQALAAYHAPLLLQIIAFYFVTTERRVPTPRVQRTTSALAILIVLIWAAIPAPLIWFTETVEAAAQYVEVSTVYAQSVAALAIVFYFRPVNRGSAQRT